MTKTGYLPDSPDRFNEFNIIPSGQITMKNVPHPVLGIDDQGNQMLMHPGANYTFPGNYVTEVPIKQEGGNVYDNDYYAQNATLSYYKNILNDKLKAKNPKAYQDYFSGLVKARQSGNAEEKYKYIQEAAYNDFLSPDEVKQTLGDNYDTYLNSLQAVNKYKVQQGQQALYGTEEGNKEINQLNYGRRFASLEVTPTMNYTNKTRNTTYARTYNYDPQTGVSYSESGDLSLNPFVAKKQMGGPQAAGVPGTNPGQTPPNFMDKIRAGANNFGTGVANYMTDPYNFGNIMDMTSGVINTFSQHSRDKEFNNYLRDNMTGDSFAVQPGGDRGDYQVTGSAYGMFRPDQMGAKSPYGTTGMYYPRAQSGGIIANEIDATPQFLGNSSTREYSGAEYLPPFSAQIGPNNTPINFPTYNANKQVSINNNTKAAYDYYTKDKNLPSHIAAGIVGNLYQESGLKPGATETTNTAEGRGIAQWGVNGRWQGFLSWAKTQGKDPYDLRAQLDYVLVEPGESGKALAQLKNTTTPEQAAIIFGKLYERPKDSAANWDTRTSIAARLASGRFEKGGEYEMSDDELQQFMQAGGEVEYL